jgi:hypothetical protein
VQAAVTASLWIPRSGKFTLGGSLKDNMADSRGAKPIAATIRAARHGTTSKHPKLKEGH